jgi:hypothetical protein
MLKMKDHRDEYLGIFNQSEEERKRSEKIKFDKQEQDNFNTKQLLSNFEKKLESELDSRIKNETDLRKYLETKFLNLQDQMKSDEKLSLEREKRMMT